MNTRELAKLACDALADKKAGDVKVIDIREISVIADYFILADGENQNQLAAMQEAVDEAFYKAGLHVKQAILSCISFPRRTDCFTIWKGFGGTAF